MRTRDIEGSAEQLIAGLITSGETAIDDATIDAVMDLIDQYIALHGVRWRDVLQRRAATCEDDPSSAIEPGLN